ncbi:MAG: uncharacterized protein KVP18_001971 [Porospora cf. gigantea A]|uniref:uncharacterized protein n=1 Tax=Porospora cf. gigantea A TaxID=2853593 RepID=UPI00355A82DA|nr:MAG: hypothetical protein KVP18_001971 [Porospora cf. gigantea A]
MSRIILSQKKHPSNRQGILSASLGLATGTATDPLLEDSQRRYGGLSDHTFPKSGMSCISTTASQFRSETLSPRSPRPIPFYDIRSSAHPDALKFQDVGFWPQDFDYNTHQCKTYDPTVRTSDLSEVEPVAFDDGTWGVMQKDSERMVKSIDMNMDYMPPNHKSVFQRPPPRHPTVQNIRMPVRMQQGNGGVYTDASTNQTLRYDPGLVPVQNQTTVISSANHPCAAKDELLPTDLSNAPVDTAPHNATPSKMQKAFILLRNKWIGNDTRIDPKNFHPADRVPSGDDLRNVFVNAVGRSEDSLLESPAESTEYENLLKDFLHFRRFFNRNPFEERRCQSRAWLGRKSKHNIFDVWNTLKKSQVEYINHCVEVMKTETSRLRTTAVSPYECSLAMDVEANTRSEAMLVLANCKETQVVFDIHRMNKVMTDFLTSTTQGKAVYDESAWRDVVSARLNSAGLTVVTVRTDTHETEYILAEGPSDILLRPAVPLKEDQQIFPYNNTGLVNFKDTFYLDHQHRARMRCAATHSAYPPHIIADQPNLSTMYPVIVPHASSFQNIQVLSGGFGCMGSPEAYYDVNSGVNSLFPAMSVFGAGWDTKQAYSYGKCFVMAKLLCEELRQYKQNSVTTQLLSNVQHNLEEVELAAISTQVLQKRVNAADEDKEAHLNELLIRLSRMWLDITEELQTVADHHAESAYAEMKSMEARGQGNFLTFQAGIDRDFTRDDPKGICRGLQGIRNELGYLLPPVIRRNLTVTTAKERAAAVEVARVRLTKRFPHLSAEEENELNRRWDDETNKEPFLIVPDNMEPFPSFAVYPTDVLLPTKNSEPFQLKPFESVMARDVAFGLDSPNASVPFYHTQSRPNRSLAQTLESWSGVMSEDTIRNLDPRHPLRGWRPFEQQADIKALNKKRKL